MARRPSGWKVRVGTGVPDTIVEEEIAQLRDLPYSVWREIIDAPRTKTRTQGGKAYAVRLEATWAAPDSEDIRVTVAARTAGWSFHPALRKSFVITTDSRVFQ